MTNSAARPASVLAASGGTALFAAGLAVMAALSLVGPSGRLGVGVALVLLLWAVVPAVGAWGLFRLRRWSRGPVVAAGLLHLAAFAGFVPSQPWAAVAALTAAGTVAAAVWPTTTRALHLDGQEGPTPLDLDEQDGPSLR